MNITITVKKSIRYLIFSSITSCLLFYAAPSYSQTYPIYSSLFSTAYNASESLSFGYSYDGIGYTENLGTAAVTGDISAKYAQTGQNCFYFQLSSSNLSTSYDGINISIPAFTTPWCQYLGIAVSCPVYNTATFSQDGISSSLALTLDLSPPSATPSFTVDWHESMDVTVIPAIPGYNVCIWPAPCFNTGTPAVTAKESAVISFPAGGFADYVISNALSAASQASGCAPPA